MTRDDAVALQRRRVGSVNVPFPIASGAAFRVLGLVTFTLTDRGGGTIQAKVENHFPHPVRAIVIWSWGRTAGITQSLMAAATASVLQIHLPAGFDAPLELLVNDTFSGPVAALKQPRGFPVVLS
jgi:hypothetical protein